MNLTEIKTLIDTMAASDLSEMAWARDGIQLRLVRQKAQAVDGIQKAPAAIQPQAQRTPGTPPPARHVPPKPTDTEIAAPLYGVVHWKPSPGAVPFVAPGQVITAGQVVCVVEAMKVFNEVRAEADGTVKALLVESGAEVEAGQPLLSLG